MNSQKIYCSACDREVSVLFTDVSGGAQGTVQFAHHDIVCLEMGEWCTGNLCPVSAVSPAEMAKRAAAKAATPPAPKPDAGS
jgi:hypothetical protein